ncbi:MAG: TonB-dependent receptor, partial [Cyclobacteriaceae bacterium]
EVVVVGYGSLKKSDLTGSVSSVDQDKLTAFPALSAIQTLQGRAPGLTIQSNNGGQPGADFNVRIRGGTSLNASSDPIRVVDGFVGAEMPPPEDIASIEILKDASATAIYGSRGANGVILITTKKGTSGKSTINLSSSFSVQEVLNELDLLNATEFADYISEVNPNYVPGNQNTDWQDQIYRSGHISNHQLSFSGGAKDIQYYISGTAFNQQGAVEGSDYERYTMTSNLNFKATEYLQVGMNMYGRRSVTEGINTQESTGGSGSAGAVSSAFRFNPDLGVFDENGDFTISAVGDDIDNPFALTRAYVRERLSDRFQMNTFGEVTLTDWMSFKTTLGYTVSNRREGEYFPSTLIRGGAIGGRAEVDTQKSTSLLSENYATISRPIGSTDLNLVLGYSIQKNTNERVEARATGFVTDNTIFWNLSGASNPDIPRTSFNEVLIKSYYTRANYSLFDKYLLTFTARYDGSSNFAANKKWAFFPSGAVGWDMAEESFMSQFSFIDRFKWRASYGLVGNQGIGANQSLSTLQAIYNPNGDNALRGQNLENPDLTWETTEQYDIGLDLMLFKGRVELIVDYYNKITTDLLFEVPIPSIIGYEDTQFQNLGKIENKGWEFALNTFSEKGDFTWESDINVSINRNKVLELPDDNADIFYGSAPGHLLLPANTQVLRVGQPIGVFHGFLYDRVYQNGDEFIPGPGFENEAGGEKFVDVSGDNFLDSDDQTIIGDPNPDFIWGFNNTFTYKNFDFNVFVQGSQGGEMLSYTLFELDILTGANNATRDALNRWTPTNPNTDTPKASNQRVRRISDRWVYDASYIRLSNIMVGYTFPEKALKSLKLRSLRVFASAQNLLTITEFPGLDPEVGYRNGSNNANGNLMRGLDYGSYPNVKNYTLGLKIGL